MTMQTEYLGLKLKNPLVPSSSPMSRSLDLARQLEDNGAGALVMYSLFEEEILKEHHHTLPTLKDQAVGHAEAQSYLPDHHELPAEVDRYLDHLRNLKDSLEIPVIASLNGVNLSGWLDYSQELERAGADALELNVYYYSTDPAESSLDVENRYIELLKALRTQVKIPICMKLTPNFTAPVQVIRRMEEHGAQGVSMFNRVFLPDIDVDTMRIVHRLQLSHPEELLQVKRWIAVMYGQTKLTLSATGGVHSADDVIKLLLSGADVVHLCSVLFEKGTREIQHMLERLRHWMEQHGFESIEEFRGTLSLMHTEADELYGRDSYYKMLRQFPL